MPARSAAAERKKSRSTRDEALERLAANDPRKSQVIELLFFGGLTYEESAAALDISEATLHRELKMAKAWLHRELTEA